MSVDVHWNTVGLCKGLIKTVSYVQSNIKEIHDIFVNLNIYLQTMIFKYFLDFLLHDVSLPGSEPAVAEPVVTERSETDTESTLHGWFHHVIIDLTSPW